MKPRVLLRQELNMPITPNEVAIMRNECTVNKLCALIDKKLEQYTETELLEFSFHAGTGAQIEQTILETYRQAGWNVSLDYSAHKLVFCPAGETNQNVALRESHLAEVLETVSRLITHISIARKILMVDALENDIVGSYIDESNDAQSLCINNLGQVVDYTGPDSNNLIHLREYVKTDCKSTIIANTLVEQEEALVAKLLNSAATHEQTIYTYSDTFNRAVLDSMSSLENLGLMPAKLIMNAFTYRRLMYLDCIHGKFEECTQRDILMRGLYAHLFTMDVHICQSIPVDFAYIVPPAQLLGVFTIPKTKGFHVYADEVATHGLHTESRLVSETNSYQTLIYPQHVRKIAIRW
jgi:hypothetical protein